MSATDTIAIATGVHRRPPRRWATVLRRPLLVGSGLFVLLVCIAVAAAPLIAPADPLEQDLTNVFAAPGPGNPLGTDGLGRDILSRLLYGGQPALSGMVAAVLVFAALGLLLGIVAGYLGGWTDRVIVVILDIMLSVPSIVLMLSVLAIFSANGYAAMIVLGIFASANLARLIRSSCLSLREELFVDAARVAGLGPWTIMRRHILPSLLGPLVVQVMLFAGIALIVQTGLGFLGLATPLPAPSWGGMVGEASQVVQRQPWFLYITGGLITLLAIAFGLLGDGLRDLEADRRQIGGGISATTPPRRRAGALAGEDVAAGDAVLSVRDLTVAFTAADGEKDVVRSVSFDVRRGEIFGLVGESGSGKTVTALSLMNLLPENGAVVAGGAFLEGDRISPLSGAAAAAVRGRRVGLVSQEPMVALDPNFTIGAQMAEVLGRIGGLRTRADKRAQAHKLLSEVRLPDPDRVLSSYPHQLSGGMLQRVVIAIALAGSPRILLADEPTTALDVTVQAEILDLLRRLRDERGMSVIIVTHDLGVVADLCDRAIVMKDGRIVEEGAVEDIFYRPSDPYTRTLLESTPSITEVRHD